MLRRTIQVLALTEGALLLAVLVLAIFSSSDPAGDAMASGFGVLAALAFLLFVLPALWAVRRNRYLCPALGLVLVPLLVLLLSIGGMG